MKKLIPILLILAAATVAGCGNVFVKGDAANALETSAMDAYVAATKADGAVGKAYLEENFKQWRAFVRSNRRDANWGPKLPSEVIGAPAEAPQAGVTAADKAMKATTGNHKALLIGINAYPPPNRLAGCVPDAKNLQAMLVSSGRFKATEIRLLMDRQATAANIRAGLAWLAADYRPGDHRFLSYSGHGAQMPCKDEADKLMEVICPIDFDWSEERAITDRDFYAAFKDIPPGAVFDWISDSCHSGGLAGTKDGVGRGRPRVMLAPADIAGKIEAALARGAQVRSVKHVDLNVGFISGCRSNQYSADAEIDGQPCGACTWAFLKQIEANPDLPISKIAAGMRADLKAAGFTQQPVADGVRVRKPFQK